MVSPERQDFEKIYSPFDTYNKISVNGIAKYSHSCEKQTFLYLVSYCVVSEGNLDLRLGRLTGIGSCQVKKPFNTSPH